MAAQDYKVIQFKAGTFQDNYGNTWCDMALEGVGEPVRIVVKDPTTIHDGDVLFGEIREHESKAGKTYKRFHKVQREQQSFTSQGKKEWQPRDDMAIRAQWAIGQACNFELLLAQVAAQLKDETSAMTQEPERELLFQAIEIDAKKLYAMVDRVKGSSESTSPKAQSQTGSEQSLSEQTSTTPKQPARDWDTLGKGQSQEEVDSLVASAVGHFEDSQDEPINLDSIPF